jgi:hypothetical protein
MRPILIALALAIAAPAAVQAMTCQEAVVNAVFFASDREKGRPGDSLTRLRHAEADPSYASDLPTLRWLYADVMAHPNFSSFEVEERIALLCRRSARAAEQAREDALTR